MHTSANSGLMWDRMNWIQRLKNQRSTITQSIETSTEYSMMESQKSLEDTAKINPNGGCQRKHEHYHTRDAGNGFILLKQ